MYEIDSRRETNVVCIRFERESQHGDRFPLHYPESAPDLFDHMANALAIDLFDLFEQREINAGPLSKMHECLQILGQTESPEAKASVQETAPDPGIHSHCSRHFLNVGSEPLRQIGNHVGVGN